MAASRRLLGLASSTPILVSLGLGLRTYHYLRDAPMWHDEASFVLNVLGKGFGELLGKLDFAEAAPPLFLWLEKLSVLLLGDSTLALRLLPYLSSCLALVVLARLAHQLLDARAVPWALVLFAFSDHLLWHTCEAKPYSMDVLLAVLLLQLFVSTRCWVAWRRLVAFTLAAPFLIFLSYPGCFLCGGLLFALLPTLVKGAGWRPRVAYLALAAAVIGSFGLLVLGPVHAQRCANMDSCWVDCFPPLDRPAVLPFWIALNTVQIPRYCCEPAGNVLIVLAVFGALSLWKRWSALVVLLLVPCFLPLAAAMIHAYPYTAARVLVYTTPAWALLMGEGAVVLVDWLAMWRQRRTEFMPFCYRLERNEFRSTARIGAQVVTAVVGVLFFLTPGYAVVRIVIPAPRTDCERAASYILERLQSGDAITSDAPEARYYLRQRMRDFISPEKLSSVQPGRLWIVGTGHTEKERIACLGKLRPGDWQIARERDYPLTTVYRLDYCRPTPGSGLTWEGEAPAEPSKQARQEPRPPRTGRYATPARGDGGLSP